MKIKTLTLGALTSAILLFTGCADKVDSYSPSAKNIMAAKNLFANTQSKNIYIASFADDRAEKKMMCRLAGPIGAPDGMTFASYIEDALRTELEVAGVHSQNSSIKITGKLNDLYGSTMIGNAYWSFDATLISSNGKSINLKSRYDYESSYAAYSACREMQRSFVPATQKFVNDILTNPQFPELLK